MARQRKPKQRQPKQRTVKGFEHAAGAAAARMGLRNICWVSIQIPETDDEVTAYVNFEHMQVIPWNRQAYQVRAAMNQFAYDWTCWWILEMHNGMHSFYKFAELPVPHKRKLRDILKPVAAKGQELTERERLDHITARGAVFTVSDHQFTDEQLDQLFTLVRQHGTPTSQIKQVS